MENYSPDYWGFPPFLLSLPFTILFFPSTIPINSVIWKEGRSVIKKERSGGKAQYQAAPHPDKWTARFTKRCSPLIRVRSSLILSFSSGSFLFYILRYLLEWWRERRELWMGEEGEMEEILNNRENSFPFQEWIWTRKKPAKRIIFIIIRLLYIR